MPGPNSTLDIDYFKKGASGEPMPGALLLFSSDAPKCGPLPLEGNELVIGRESPASLVLDDRSLSRRHVRITFAEGRFEVEDLGSKNGLVLDGAQVPPNGKGAPGGRILRVGRTVFALVPDLRPYLARTVSTSDGQVVGPVLGGAWDLIDQASRTSDILHLHAESGAGKELAARRFHAKGQRPNGPFVAVNCAAIPEGVAERLLFGAKKGSFSGATADVEGYFEAANGGTLFLDEVGDLDLDVQAKLLRTIETHEVLILGAAKPKRVDVRLVSATHHDLRKAVAEKRFRDDLFFRLGKPSVELPPLRERPEEIAFLALQAAARIDKSLHPSAAFIEACLLREWPGNVRELSTKSRTPLEGLRSKAFLKSSRSCWIQKPAGEPPLRNRCPQDLDRPRRSSRLTT